MTARARRSTWTMPIALALASLLGLLSALTGDGLRDVLAWVGLAMPIAATLWGPLTRRHFYRKGLS